MRHNIMCKTLFGKNISYLTKKKNIMWQNTLYDIKSLGGFNISRQNYYLVEYNMG